jgi:lipopolysaccharide export LptBFGC system permease protein LptF
MSDKHNLQRISSVLAIIASAFFAAVAVAGYQRTEDVSQLLLFLGLAVLAFAVVKFLFFGIGRLLDRIDPS